MVSPLQGWNSQPTLDILFFSRLLMLTIPELNVQMEWNQEGDPLPTDPGPSRTFELHMYVTPTCIQVRAVHTGQALVCLHRLLCVYVCVP